MVKKIIGLFKIKIIWTKQESVREKEPKKQHSKEVESKEEDYLSRALKVLEDTRNNYQHPEFHKIVDGTKEAFCANPENFNNKIKGGDYSAEAVTYTILALSTEDSIVSGAFHVHMVIGSLSDSGLLLLEIFDELIDKATNHGTSIDEAKDIKANIREKIKTQRR